MAGMGKERKTNDCEPRGFTASHLGDLYSIDAMRKVRGPSTLLVSLRIVGISMMALRAQSAPQVCIDQDAGLTGPVYMVPVIPPLTEIHCAVIHRLFSDTSRSVASAISSTVPSRLAARVCSNREV
jgi:hypothetical protein